MNKYPFMPIGTQLLLKEVEMSEFSAGGIILPESQRKPINQGEILSMGKDVPIVCNGVDDTEDAFRIGNIVVFPLYADTKFSMDRKTHIIVDYTQIILSDYGFFNNQSKKI